MKEYEAYLFDWDGTIARTLEVWLEIVRDLFAAYGITGLTDDKLVESLGALKAIALEVGVKPEDIKHFMADTEKLSREKVPEAELYEGALDALEALKNQGKKLALITTGWRSTIMHVLELHGLSGVFDIVITGNDVANIKPDPEGINKALEYFDVDKNQAVMIGDSTNDLLAARNAGIDSILSYPPSHQLFYRLPELEVCGPKRIIAGWNELLSEA
jgi:HAD superfamily hydrolase (TIGR01509 family)